MDIKAERFSAIDRKPGIIGCTASHLAVIKRAKEEGWPNVLIFEDDFMFLVDKHTFENNLRNFFSSNIYYDVLLLGYNLKGTSEQINEFISRGHDIQAPSGYIVKNTFYDKLINTWESALENLIATNMHWLYANDQSWKILQTANKFLYFNTRIGKQRGSWRDNSECYMEYTDS
jgi:GR25 family glycosyltransferase involved in LPS biosynthesis